MAITTFKSPYVVTIRGIGGRWNKVGAYKTLDAGKKAAQRFANRHGEARLYHAFNDEEHGIFTARKKNGTGRKKKTKTSTAHHKTTATKARKTAPKNKARTRASKVGKEKRTKAAKPKPTRKAARARNGNGRRPGPKLTRRKNSTSEAAAEMYEAFHGKPPASAKTYRREIEYQDKLAELGKLLRLDVECPGGDVELDFTGPVKLCCEPSGKQLYIIGGNQAIDLETLPMGAADIEKDHVTLGPCTFVVYMTAKGFHDFEPTEYGHEFGEEGGELPTLNYDRMNRLLYLTGGSYRVKPEGIVD